MNLYTLSHNYQQILSLIEDGTEGLDDTLESLTDAIEDKLENIGKVIKTIDAEAVALKTEEERLAMRRRSLEGNSERLKAYAEKSMNDVGLKKVKGSLFSFNIQNNPPSVLVLDETKIPSNYLIKQDPKVDVAYISKVLKTGVKIPGVQLNYGESLRIK